MTIERNGSKSALIDDSISAHFGIIPEDEREKFIEGEARWLAAGLGISLQDARKLAERRLISHNRITAAGEQFAQELMR